MRFKHLAVLFTPALLAPAGCATSPFEASHEELARHDVGELSPVQRRSLVRASSPGAAPEEPDVAPASEEEFVRLAEARNPRLLAARQRALRMHERVDQATSLADPMLEVTPIGEMAETAAGQVDLMAGVSQRLPYPGKLDARGRVAEEGARAASEAIEEVRRSVVAETRRAYWSFYFAVRALEITERNGALLTQVHDLAQAQYRAGAVSQEAVLRASVERSNIDNRLLELTQRRNSAQAMLNTLVDRPPGAPIPDPPAVRPAQIVEDADALTAAARDASPQVLALRAELAQGRAQRDLARLDRYPDLTVSVAYSWVDDNGLSAVANGDDQWWVGFGVNLPIWQGRLRAAEREATRAMLETAGMLASEQNQAMYRVHDALARIESQQRQIALLESSILPDAQQSVDSALSGFRAGGVRFLTVVDNWRTLLDLELTLESSVVALETAIADLEETVGRELNRRAPEEPRND